MSVHKKRSSKDKLQAMKNKSDEIKKKAFSESEKSDNAYSQFPQEALVSSHHVAAAKAEESDVIKMAMKEAEESYTEMMEIHKVLDEAYQDLMKLQKP